MLYCTGRVTNFVCLFWRVFVHVSLIKTFFVLKNLFSVLAG